MVLKHEGKNLNNNKVVVPTGFEPVFESRPYVRLVFHYVR